MTSLIDVIFLLLLFFMLSTSFSRFSEIEIGLGQGANNAASLENTLFLRLSSDNVTLNGEALNDDAFRDALAAAQHGAVMLVSVAPDTSAQRLTDILVIARRQPHISVTVLAPS